MPKTLVFFNSVDQLSTAYALMTTSIGQESGDRRPLIRMYHSTTSDEMKEAAIADINSPSGYTR